MVQACSIKLSQDFGTHPRHGCNGYHTSVMRKRRLNFAHINLSSHALPHHAWSLHALNAVHRPLKSVYSRYNLFVCRSVLIPGGGNHVPALKNAAVVLSRSYAALCGSSQPLVLKLIPAVGVIAFAVWGLDPIMRLCRIIVLRKNDSTWSKSSTHYVMTSYLQPLLLWTGAILICRALDPVVLPTEASQAVKQRVLNFVQSLSTALAFAYCLSSLIQQVRKLFMEKNDSGGATNMGFNFAWNAIYYGVWVAAASFFMEFMGFSTQKWLTAGGFSTVLITLAGREALENFLSSVMLHATRPFIASEWIQTNIGGSEVSGVVERVGWWSPTIVRGDDREAIHIPNKKFNVSVVRNLSQKTHWRIKTYFAISHLDFDKISDIVANMRKVIANNSHIEQRGLHRRVFFENIDPETQAHMILVSCFVKTPRIEEYLCVKEDILLTLRRVIEHHEANLATPIRTVHKVYSKADMDNIPFAETIFTRPRSAARRRLLLTEAKVNSDDKSKGPKDETTVTSTPDSKADAVIGGSTLTVDPIMDDRVTAPPSESNSGTKPQTQKESLADAMKEIVGINSEQSGTLSKKAEVKTQANQDNEKNVASPPIIRPPMEENIVLGVALEGSKRTLPIEDDEISPPPVPAKDKKDGSMSPVGKDKKDGSMSAVHGASD